MNASRAAPSRIAGSLRTNARLIAMVAWLLVALTGFALWQLAKARNPWPRRFLGGIAHLAGLRIRIAGQPAAGRLLLLANHISWLDIPALAAITGTAFVAHDGLAEVPVLNWLCGLNGTIFVARRDRTGVGVQIDSLRAALFARTIITVFPEGTSGDGTALRPFKSALLAALDPPPPDIAVQPVWLDYGRLAPMIAWGDEETGVANVRRILARRKPLDLTIHFLEPLPAATLTDRKAMANGAHRAIASAMGLLEPAQLAYGPRDEDAARNLPH